MIRTRNLVKFANFIWIIAFCSSCQHNSTSNGLSQFKNLDSVSDFAPELWIQENSFKGSFSADFNSFYFFRKEAPGVENYIPMVSHFKNGVWQKPTPPDFYDPSYSYTYQLADPNSDRLFYISNQRMKADTTQTPNYNFWYMNINKSKYSDPQELGHRSLMYHYNSQPCITNTGRIYFNADLPDWSETLSYVMDVRNQEHSEPVLFEPVNEWRKNEDWTVFEYCVSPNEDFMIVCIQDRSVTTLSADLYISYAKHNSWTRPELLGHGINSDGTENFPVITHDGKYMIYTRAFSEFKIVPTAIFLTSGS